MVLVLMGVSGSGKTTVGEIVASRLGWPFEEGDQLHSKSEVEKMESGHPLTDEDRAPWLERVAAWAGGQIDSGQNGVITCSALKRPYRDLINRRGRGVVFVLLSGSKELIAARVGTRHGHFMPASLLDSQFSDLEAPQADEPVITVDIGPTPDAIAQQIIDRAVYSQRDS
jgi:carbohydrate kinase (thermoresistant glucokinase family)